MRFPTPATGRFQFFAGRVARSTLRQTVDVRPWRADVEAEAVWVTLDAQVRDWSGSDGAGLAIEARGADGEVLARVDGELFRAANWTARRLAAPVPRGTESITVALIGERNGNGDNDAYFDDVRLCLSGEAPPVEPGRSVVPPYLMWVTQTAVTVLWETEDAVVGRVRYGTDALDAVVAEAGPRTLHELRLTGLAPDTAYTYQPEWEDVALAPRTFRTAPGPGVPFDFVVWGDNQNGPNIFRGLVGRMRDQAPRFALSTGDCVQWGLQDLYRSELLDPIGPLAGEVPFLVAAGNHERLIDFAADLFERYMAQPGDEHCFGWAYGDAYFVLVDTELSVRPGSVQHACIADALGSEAAQAADFRAVLFHKPPRVEYWAGFCYTGEADVRDVLEPLFADLGVDVVFNGHNHLYAYTPPGPNGITWVTTGGGGGAIDDEGDFCRTWDEIDVTAFVHHFLSVHVEDRVMTVRAIDEAGEELHRFEVRPR